MIWIISTCAAVSFGLPPAVALLNLPIPPLAVQFAAYVTPFAGAAIVALYEWKGWRLLNPHLDFSGPWVFQETQFTIDENGKTREFGDAWGVINIKQSVRRIYINHAETVRGAMPPTLAEAEKMLRTCDKMREATWRSRAMDLTDDGDAIYVCLEHESKKAPGNAHVRYAVEVISIAPGAVSRRPTQMSSDVHHCVGAGTPRTIDCQYERGSLENFYERLGTPQSSSETKAPPQAAAPENAKAVEPANVDESR